MACVRAGHQSGIITVTISANRFRIDECFFIVIAGAAIGCAIALVIQVIFNLFRKE